MCRFARADPTGAYPICRRAIAINTPRAWFPDRTGHDASPRISVADAMTTEPQATRMELLLATLTDLAGLDDLDRSWIHVVWVLLVFCRDNAGTPQEWAALPPEELDRTIAQVRTAAGEILPLDASSSFATAIEISTLRRFIDAIHAEHGEALGELSATAIAHASALAIDDRFGESFLEWFRAQTDVTVRDGHLYPIRRHNPLRWLRPNGRPSAGDEPRAPAPEPPPPAHVSANTNPARLPTRRLERTARLGLGTPGTSTYHVTIDFDMWGRLSPLGVDEPLRIAVLQPNLHLGEFAITYDDGPPKSFTNRGPIDGALQVQMLVDQIGRAAAEGARILLAPEYTIAEQDRTTLLHSVESLPIQPNLIVIGSCAPDTRDRMRNEPWLLIPGPPGGSFDRAGPAKMFPAEIDGYVENLARGSEVRIIHTIDWTIGVLTCRDAMEPQLLALLADAGVNLLLVPAMSPRTTSLIDLTTSLRATSQALTAVAVGPARWDGPDTESPSPRGEQHRPEAAFDGPYDLTPSVTVLPERTAPPGPQDRGLWVFDVPLRVAEWHHEPQYNY